MKITDLIIDPRSLGSKLWLVEVSPAYEYRENRKTDTVKWRLWPVSCSRRYRPFSRARKDSGNLPSGKRNRNRTR